jgi:hypothetical protein
MVVNFRARGISRGARKLTRTSTLNKKKKKQREKQKQNAIKTQPFLFAKVKCVESISSIIHAKTIYGCMRIWILINS